MMHSHAQSIAASAMTRRQMGLQGRYLGAPIQSEKLAQIGVDAGTAFLTSGGDVDKLYEPAFSALSVLSLALPTPLNALASIGLTGVKMSVDAIRGEIKEAFRGAGQYLPLDVSRKVTKELITSPLTYWNAAAHDKFAQYAFTNILDMAAIAAYNAAVSEDNKLNINAHARLANRMYDLCIKNGAKDWQAAMVAYRVGNNSGASDTERAPWAGKLSKALSDKQYSSKDMTALQPITNFNQAESAWKKIVGLDGGTLVTAQQAKTLPAAGMAVPGGLGGGFQIDPVWIAVGGLGVVALALLLGRRGGGSNV